MASLAKAIPEQSATLHEAQVSASLPSSQMMLSRKRKLSEICDLKQESKANVKMMRLNDGTKVAVTPEVASEEQAKFAIQADKTKPEEQASKHAASFKSVASQTRRKIGRPIGSTKKPKKEAVESSTGDQGTQV